MERDRIKRSAIADGLLLLLLFTLAVLAAVAPVAVIALSIPAFVLYRHAAGQHSGSSSSF